MNQQNAIAIANANDEDDYGHEVVCLNVGDRPLYLYEFLSAFD